MNENDGKCTWTPAPEIRRSLILAYYGATYRGSCGYWDTIIPTVCPNCKQETKTE